MFSYILVLLTNTLILYFYSMASTVPLVLEYAFVGLRLKMDIKQNSLTSSAIFCRYGDTNEVFPIGGLVPFGETPIGAG